ncbi:4Fe-4S dicluster domain-containing protein [Paraconexibacter sp.]|uniref:4Fe-4S dicluster domain-containing protein n=1 Tax=Paraconexibacter sp. TaxID=2949640 RepID=UPI00356641C1
MTKIGFVLDQRSCIGCHACTVACKQEHGVELGVFRTWVKYVETGTFPDVKRNFSVMRCNHCEDAPCVAICPTKALFKREDGVVDFDSDRCIGCKACMNACPYDALYIDPQTQTAAKCNFCAHRLDEGLKPSCEIVCPTQAITSGDLDDPDSEVSRLIDTVPSRVRAPEQGTRPQVFYLGVHDAAIDPLAIAQGREYLSQIPDSQREKLRPLKDEGTATTVSDIAHPPPWGWKVSSYFLSKGVAAGAMMLAVLLLVVGADGSALADVVPGAVALAGIAVTGLFLVWDLKQPTRFYYLFTKPQRRSWLALGAQVINLAAIVALVFTVAAILDLDGLRDALRWAMVPAGAALAGYTALLFNQCEGRDLWQSPLLLPHTIVNALLAGAGTLAVAALFFDVSADIEDALAWSLGLAAALSGAIALLDAYGRHPTRQAERAAKNLRRDLYARPFRAGLLLGALVPAAVAAAVLAGAPSALLAGGGVVALVGLWLYEDAWVRAGQSVPLS